MNNKYEIPTLNIEDLKLDDSLTTIHPLETIDISSIGMNGTSATDLTWQGSGGYTTSAVPNVTIGSGITGTAGGYVWTTTTTPNNWGTISAGTPNQSGKITLQGENADVDINGKSLKTWMEKVEERLNILTPNLELEQEWDDLRRLGERYRKLEKRCKEKAEAWNKLKSMPPPKVG